MSANTSERLRFRHATSAADVEEFQQIQRQAFGRQLNCTLKIPDSYDQQALYLIIIDSSQIVGGLRLIYRDLLPLPLETLQPINFTQPPCCYGELSRAAMLEGTQLSVIERRQFLRFTAAIAASRGLRTLLIEAFLPLSKFYRYLNFKEISAPGIDPDLCSDSNTVQPNYVAMAAEVDDLLRHSCADAPAVPASQIPATRQAPDQCR